MVDLVVPFDTLTGASESPGEISGWGPVLGDIARQIALRQQDSEWRFTVVDPDTGAVLAQGVTRRRPTAAQSRFVNARHRTCVFVGCRMPATDCDLDHLRRHADAGPTHTTNLRPLCRHDHRLEDAGWDLVAHADGTHSCTSPLGHTYVTDPSP